MVAVTLYAESKWDDRPSSTALSSVIIYRLCFLRCPTVALAAAGARGGTAVGVRWGIRRAEGHSNLLLA